MGKPVLFLRTPFDERYPAFSPDGHWLAYASNESGTFQVYVRAFPDTGGKWQVSIDGGTYPTWARDGNQLFFEDLDGQLLTTTYSAKMNSFVSDRPHVWSKNRLAKVVNTIRNFDVAPDSKHVIALMPAEDAGMQPSQSHVVFLENFFDELRRRVPVNK